VGDSYPFVVVLCWIDYPGAANTYPVIVNDLDLVVEDPSGTRYFGNVASGGWSVPGGQRDTLNTWEMCKFQTPLVGTWKVIIKGSNIPQPRPGGALPFALVLTGDIIAPTGIEENKNLLTLSCLKDGILIELPFYRDPLFSISIMRAERGKGKFELIKEIKYPEIPFKWKDKKGLVKGKEYEYKIMVKALPGYSEWFGPFSIKYVDEIPLEIKVFSSFIRKNKLKFSFTLRDRTPVSIFITDVAGRKVHTMLESSDFPPGFHILEYDLKTTRIEKGVYFLNIKTDKDFVSSKIYVIE